MSKSPEENQPKGSLWMSSRELARAQAAALERTKTEGPQGTCGEKGRIAPSPETRRLQVLEVIVHVET